MIDNDRSVIFNYIEHGYYIIIHSRYPLLYPWDERNVLKPEQMDGKRFKYISAISLLTVWGALGPWLERTGACWLVQQAP